jgi:hypothetical protein
MGPNAARIVFKRDRHFPVDGAARLLAGSIQIQFMAGVVLSATTFHHI